MFGMEGKMVNVEGTFAKGYCPCTCTLQTSNISDIGIKLYLSCAIG